MPADHHRDDDGPETLDVTPEDGHDQGEPAEGQTHPRTLTLAGGRLEAIASPPPIPTEGPPTAEGVDLLDLGDANVETFEEVDPEPIEGAEAHELDPDAAPKATDRATRKLLREIQEEHARAAGPGLGRGQAEEDGAEDAGDDPLHQEYLAHVEQVASMADELGLDPDRPVTQIPPVEEAHVEEVSFAPVEQGISYIRILYNERTSRYLYQVIEPELTETEEEILAFLKDTLVRTMEGRFDEDEQDWEGYLEQEVERAVLDHSILIDRVGKQRLTYYIKRDFLGYGPIDVIMQDPMIEDISCDGPGIPIYIFHREHESIRTNVVFEEETALDSFVIRTAQRSGKHISIAEPMLDATLPDTSRLQATLAREVTTRGSSFTIRKFRADPLTPPDLIRFGTMSSRMAAFLWIAMEDGAPMVMAGGTASGKTTTLNAMCQFIPPTKKVVSIEDTREVNLIHENWIAGLTRAGFAGKEGEGTVDMYQLLEAALRQRPEYLLVGEVRGPEAQTLFQAMATGHATYSTLHADSVRSAVHRLENPPIDVPRMMLETLDGVAVQTQARVDGTMVRRVKDLTEVVGIEERTGHLLTNQVYQWDPKEDRHEYLGNSHILQQRIEDRNLTRSEIEQEWANRALVMEWMVEKGVRHITDVNNVLAAYYARPDELLDHIEDATEIQAPAITVGAGSSEEVLDDA